MQIPVSHEISIDFGVCDAGLNITIARGVQGMDAEAHLRSLGWAGPGAGLRAGSLQRAILTSKKTDLKGLGAKANESDQWWDNIFSKQLSNILVGPGGSLAQINGGVSAAHPVAARNAHRKQFGEKSALEKVFVRGEVLKGNESFIPLVKDVKEIVESNTDDSKMKDKKRKRKADKVEKEERKSKRRAAKSGTPKVTRSIENVVALPSPPLSEASDSNGEDVLQSQLSHLSDKALRKQARRLRREAKEIERAAKAARKEKRRLKKAAK